MKHKKPIKLTTEQIKIFREKNGAGKGGRPLDLLVGNETLYH